MDTACTSPHEDASADWVSLDERVRSLAAKFCGGREHARCIFAGTSCQAAACKNSSSGFSYLHQCHDDPRALAAEWDCEVLALDHERAEKGPFLFRGADFRVVLSYFDVLDHLRARRQRRAIDSALPARLQGTRPLGLRL